MHSTSLGFRCNHCHKSFNHWMRCACRRIFLCLDFLGGGVGIGLDYRHTGWVGYVVSCFNGLAIFV